MSCFASLLTTNDTHTQKCMSAYENVCLFINRLFWSLQMHPSNLLCHLMISHSHHCKPYLHVDIAFIFFWTFILRRNDCSSETLWFEWSMILHFPHSNWNAPTYAITLFVRKKKTVSLLGIKQNIEYFLLFILELQFAARKVLLFLCLNYGTYLPNTYWEPMGGNVIHYSWQIPFNDVLDGFMFAIFDVPSVQNSC